MDGRAIPPCRSMTPREHYKSEPLNRSLARSQVLYPLSLSTRPPRAHPALLDGFRPAMFSILTDLGSYGMTLQPCNLVNGSMKRLSRCCVPFVHRTELARRSAARPAPPPAEPRAASPGPLPGPALRLYALAATKLRLRSTHSTGAHLVCALSACATLARAS